MVLIAHSVEWVDVFGTPKLIIKTNRGDFLGTQMCWYPTDDHAGWKFQDEDGDYLSIVHPLRWRLAWLASRELRKEKRRASDRAGRADEMRRVQQGGSQ